MLGHLNNGRRTRGLFVVLGLWTTTGGGPAVQGCTCVGGPMSTFERVNCTAISARNTIINSVLTCGDNRNPCSGAIIQDCAEVRCDANVACEETTMLNVGNVFCLARQACASSTIGDNTNRAAMVQCGRSASTTSCSGATVFAQAISCLGTGSCNSGPNFRTSLDATGSVQCRNSNACDGTTITATDVTCEAELACLSAEITATNVTCAADRACRLADITARTTSCRGDDGACQDATFTALCMDDTVPSSSPTTSGGDKENKLCRLGAFC